MQKGHFSSQKNATIHVIRMVKLEKSQFGKYHRNN